MRGAGSLPLAEAPTGDAESAGNPALSAAPSSRARRRAADAGVLALAALAACLALDGPGAVLAMAWAALVIVVIRSDLDHFRIPDAASASIAVLGLSWGALAAWPDGGVSALPGAMADALARGAAGFGVFWLVAALYRRRAGRDGLGFGDVKLAGACATWLTALQMVTALEIACLAALALVLATTRGKPRRGIAVPFGAFLAPSAWLAFMAGPLVDLIYGRLA